MAGAVTVANVALLAHGAIASGPRSAVLGILPTGSVWLLVHAVRVARAGRSLAASGLVAVVIAVAASAAGLRDEPARFHEPFRTAEGWVERDGGWIGHLVATRFEQLSAALPCDRGIPALRRRNGPVPGRGEQELLSSSRPTGRPSCVSSFAPNQFSTRGWRLACPRSSRSSSCSCRRVRRRPLEEPWLQGCGARPPHLAVVSESNPGS